MHAIHVRFHWRWFIKSNVLFVCDDRTTGIWKIPPVDTTIAHQTAESSNSRVPSLAVCPIQVIRRYRPLMRWWHGNPLCIADHFLWGIRRRVPHKNVSNMDLEIHRWPVDSPHKVSVMWTIDVCFVGGLNNLSIKHSNWCIFEASWRSLIKRRCNA